MLTNENSTGAAGSASNSPHGLATPDLKAMNMGELRCYFRALKHLEFVINGTANSSLAGLPCGPLGSWTDDAFAWIDDAMRDLCSHLDLMICTGDEEKFRRCMLAEHAAWLADDLGEVIGFAEGRKAVAA